MIVVKFCVSCEAALHSIFWLDRYCPRCHYDLDLTRHVLVRQRDLAARYLHIWKKFVILKRRRRLSDDIDKGRLLPIVLREPGVQSVITAFLAPVPVPVRLWTRV